MLSKMPVDLNHWCMEMMNFCNSISNWPYENILYVRGIFNLSKSLGVFAHIFIYLFLRQVFLVNFLSSAIHADIRVKVYLINILDTFFSTVFSLSATIWPSI